MSLSLVFGISTVNFHPSYTRADLRRFQRTFAFFYLSPFIYILTPPHPIIGQMHPQESPLTPLTFFLAQEGVKAFLKNTIWGTRVPYGGPRDTQSEFHTFRNKNSETDVSFAYGGPGTRLSPLASRLSPLASRLSDSETDAVAYGGPRRFLHMGDLGRASVSEYLVRIKKNASVPGPPYAKTSWDPHMQPRRFHGLLKTL